MAQTLAPGLERRLKTQLLGEVQFDAFTRGRYATDASHYQIMPIGVVAPRSIKEAEHALALAREEGVSVLPRGAGTSQAGQTVNSSLVIDCSKYLDHVLELDVARRALRGRARHRARRAQSPAAGRTACGSRWTSRPPRAPPSAAWWATIPAARARCATAIPARTCVSIDAVLADGTPAHFGPIAPDLSDLPPRSPLLPLARGLIDLAAREAGRDRGAFPEGPAAGRRLQSRRAPARPQRGQSRAHSGRLRGHARRSRPGSS